MSSLYKIGHLGYTCSPMKIIKIKHLEKFALTIMSLNPLFSVLNYPLINFATSITDKASNQILLSTMPYYYYAHKNERSFHQQTLTEHPDRLIL